MSTTHPFLVRYHAPYRCPAPAKSSFSLAHCRRGHFITPSNNRIATLLAKPSFPPKSEPLSRAGTLIDLYLVSVLLDAGAGPDWTFTEIDEEGNETWKGGRSEGLAVASYHMFINGLFSSSGNKFQVDGEFPSNCASTIWLTW